MSIIFTWEGSSLVKAGRRGRARAGAPMPAQQITPASGLEVNLIQARVEERAELIDEVKETFVTINSVRAGSEMADEDEG
jgi:hypothetical protein